jgi:hypothetical protein
MSRERIVQIRGLGWQQIASEAKQSWQIQAGPGHALFFGGRALQTRMNGWIDVEETDNGTVWWLRRPTEDAGDHMCMDSVTNSATVFWATIPRKINPKRFRVAAALGEWFALTAKLAAAAGQS